MMLLLMLFAIGCFLLMLSADVVLFEAVC